MTFDVFLHWLQCNFSLKFLLIFYTIIFATSQVRSSFWVSQATCLELILKFSLKS